MWQLNPNINLRPEAEGALIFNPNNAETLYLDREGLTFIRDILKGSLKSPKFPVSFFLFLQNKGILIQNGKSSPEYIGKIDSLIKNRPAKVKNSLSVPETLHIALTNACDQICMGCFYSRGQSDNEEFLSEALFEKILAQAHAFQVFQFAFGGGEPLLHPFILRFTEKSREQNIVPNITTNGNLLTAELAKKLKEAGLGQIQISLDSVDNGLNQKTRPNYDRALKAVKICREAGLRFGINTLLTRENFMGLPALIRFFETAGAAGINLLRPKPPVLSKGWLEEVSLTPRENLHLHRMLRKIVSQKKIEVTLDQSLSFLAFHRDPEELFFNGVWGCGAGRRFLTIDPTGIVYPCSHYRESLGSKGNFVEAWKNSAVLDKFRSLEDNMKGQCRECKMLKVCRGCRAVVKELGGDFIDADPHCPMLKEKDYPI
jgi:pyrroloquinoline quinone biosynthesis protein E